MNLCMVSERNCTFDEFEAVVNESEEETSAFIGDYAFGQGQRPQISIASQLHGYGSFAGFYDHAWDEAVG